jgi:hypothetical protein
MDFRVAPRQLLLHCLTSCIHAVESILPFFVVYRAIIYLIASQDLECE